MDHWNKGGLSREEFLRMRENALRQLQEKLSGVMQDGKIVVNEQIYGLLSDPKKLEMLLNSGIVGRLLKELGRQKES